MSETASKRPADTDFKQQRLKAWQPILTPWWVIGTFAVVGIAFVVLGSVLKAASDGVVEYTIKYDGKDAKGDCQNVCFGKCPGSECCGQRNCTLNITTTEDMTAPVYVYYELENFYQNHRQYVKSRADKQLQGEKGATLTGCEPLTVDPDHDKMTLVPCGLIANSLFNDTFNLTTPPLVMHETGIAWKSDLSAKFANTQEYTDAVANGGEPKDRAICTTNHWGGKTCKCNGTEPCSKYLYQSYPNIPNIREQGVTNEHFVVWMRTAGLPKFRKLYGIINQDIAAGTELHFHTEANFPVKPFSGTKSLVISTTSWFGGKNPFLGIAYTVVGSICLVLAAAFFAKHRMNPRVLGDTSYLQWGAAGERPHEH